jgi:hypothetical protein
MTRTSTDGTPAQVEPLADLRGHVLPRIDSATPLQVRYLEAILLELQWQREQLSPFLPVSAVGGQRSAKPRRKNAVRELDP